MDNPFEKPKQAVESPIRYVTIVAVVSGGVTVKFDGESTASSKPYKCNPSYTPTANDRAVMVWSSGTGVIICKYV